MFLFSFLRKIFLTLAPLALFYFLKKVARGQQLPKRDFQSSGFDKSKIVEGEIVEDKK